MACSAFGNSPSRSWDCRCCHFFHERTRIAGELSNGERSGSLTRTATRDSASLLYAARKHDCQLEHGSRCRSIGPRQTNGWKELAAGNYVMSVVSEGKTASILVNIK
ncbi:MAG: hypothetical protein DMF32_04230 [Verrucomicrobia bacterium]|nr:MAG: hypothetical protein DMF32_04230 [Verrucomicrobiota bacterium]